MKTITLSQPQALSAITVDREARTLRNVSFITAGPAIGHGFLVDGTMCEQVAASIASKKRGVKVRLSHPELAGGFFGGGTDGIEVMLGRAAAARVEGSQVKGDIVFGKYASKGPKGDMVDYLMTIAEEDPEVMGLSIMFESAEPEWDEAHNELARVSNVLSVDFVGDPAANPAGLLSKGDEMVKDKKGLAEGDVEATTAGAELVEGDVEATTAGAELVEGDVEATTDGAPGMSAATAAANALAADRKRREDIKTLATAAGLDAGWAQGLADRGISVTQATELITLAKENAPMETKVGADRNIESLGAAVGDAIAVRAGLFRPRKGIEAGTPHERAREFTGLSMIEIGRKYLRQHGIDPDTLSKMEVVTLLFSRIKFAQVTGLAMGTSDFPYILANVMGKSLRQSYELAETTWQLWATELSAPDFKQQAAQILSSAPTLAAISEGGEYTYGSFTEAREVYTLAKYGKAVKFTREAMINDDLSAFSRVVAQMGAKAKYLEDVVAYAILTANAALGNDSVALFNAASHANDGEGVLATAALNSAWAAMRTQTDLDGATLIQNEPRSLIVPVALAGTARVLVSSINDPSASLANIPNIWNGRLDVVEAPILDATSASQWYLAADPAKMDTVGVCFLEGERQPVVEEDEEFSTDARLYKVRHQVVAKALDYRGLYRSTGVAATTA